MKRWKRILLVAACALPAVAGIAFAAWWLRASSVVRRHSAEVPAAIAALRARDGSRPPLGEPLGGNGWKEHLAGLEPFGSMPEEEQDEIPGLPREEGGAFTPDPAKLEALLEKYRPAIDALRSSLRAREFKPDHAYEEGAAMECPTLRGVIRAARALSGFARHRHSQGRDREAISLLHMTLLRVATGIAWYEAEKGSFPPALADLVPRHLPRVPDCPLTGKPLRSAGGRVWSVGPDGDDDDGRGPGVDEEPEEADCDWVWAVKRK